MEREVISNAKTDILKEKFINTYVDKCKDIINYISIEDESRIALEYGEVALHDISTGGVFCGSMGTYICKWSLE